MASLPKRYVKLGQEPDPASDSLATAEIIVIDTKARFMGLDFMAERVV